MPIWYDEFGVESQIPPAMQSHYTGTEPTTTKPVPEATQAAYYRQAIQLAFCQPNVQAMMLFHSVDEAGLAQWQSGLYYAGTDVPKASLAPTRLAIQQARRGVVAHCEGMQLPVKTHVVQKAQKLTLTCDLDCFYTAQLYRGTKVVRGVSGRATGQLAKTLALKVPTTGSGYRLKLTAVNPVNPAFSMPRFVRLRPG